MPDLEATIRALLALAGDRVTVEVMGASVAVSQCYSGYSERGAPDSVFTVVVDMHADEGHYRLRYSKQERFQGWHQGVYRWSWNQTTSNHRLMEMVSRTFIGLDGTRQKETFDSRIVEGRIIATVEAHGWTRPQRTGFWARLFGRG